MPATFRSSARTPGSPDVAVDVSCLRMEGTVLPMDSMSGRKKNLGTKLSRRKSRQLRGNNMALLAAAGLDLFREGLMLDGVYPQRHTPRHPAVSPNLNSIPEDDDAVAFHATTDSQVILILGDAMDRRGEVTPLGATRISRAADLYWDTMRVYAQHQANAFCYLVRRQVECVKYGESKELIIVLCCRCLRAGRMNEKGLCRRRPSETSWWRRASRRTTS